MDYSIENNRLRIFSGNAVFLDVKAVRNANELSFFDRISFWFGNYKEVHLRDANGIDNRVFVNRTSYENNLMPILLGDCPGEEYQVLFQLVSNHGPETRMLNEVFRDVKNRVLTAVCNGDVSFQNLNSKWRADRDVVDAACIVDPKNLAYVTNSRSVTKERARQMIDADPSLFVHLPRKLKEDIVFVKAVAHQINLSHLHPAFYRNLNLIEEIYPKNPLIVQLIDNPSIARRLKRKYPAIEFDFSPGIKAQIGR